MVSLIPIWATHYDEFWNTLRRRNLWLIKLRFGAALMLGTFLLSAEFLLGLQLTFEQINAIVAITVAIFLYNLLFIYLRKFVRFTSEGFNPLHLSIIQMGMDVTMLILLCYYTGSIESPLFMLYVFHMVIGSLILPGALMYGFAGITISIFTGIIYLEYFDLLTHHSVAGLLQEPLYTNSAFILAYTTVFAFVIVMTVVITNRIARELYFMEQQLIESLVKLEEAEVEKQKYIMGVVHEIKTPLTALHSYLDLILQKYLGPLDPKVEEKLERSRIRSSEAIAMINDILKISRIKLLDELQMENVDLKDILCKLVDRQSINLQKKSIKLNLNDNRPSKTLVFGDTFLLEIAFSNLVNNAVKYTHYNGKIEINISEGNDETVVEVSDSGVGIPKNDLQKIFEDFYRASNIRHKNYDGTGLGLTIVKQIIEKHKGSVEVKSPSSIGTKSGPGTSFLVRIPSKKNK